MPSRGKSGQSERSASLDPFALALQPPANETPDEQAERTRMAKLALERSRKIDEGLLEDKKTYDRKHRAVRVLLLGQAESGKSTLLKNFKLAFCPTQFATETAGWKTVIQLNLIRSVSTLLGVLQEELDSTPQSNGSSRRPYSSGRGAPPTFSSSSSSPQSRITNEHRQLRMRLSPLIAIDEALTRKLHHTFPDAAHWTPRGENDPSKFSPGHGRKDSEGLPPLAIRRGSSHELCVRAGADWQNILVSATVKDTGRSRQATGSDDPTGALDACREDIAKLWKDEVMRDLLVKRNIRMEMGSGFFLDDVSRIARMDYEPTTEDILRARLKTVGIEEHHLELSADGHAPQDWYIYDVNGSRSTRLRWVQYFDDASAIVFLAPLAFNQFLEEDPSTNRLEDTVGLWTDICRNRLLRHATLVLLFNKRDLLARTLEEGERVVRFIPSYQGPNEPSAVTAYFKHKFVGIHKKFFQKERDLFVHETTCIDAKTTETILYGVRHAILTEHLRKLDLII